LSIYLTPPPDDQYPWRAWIPDIVVEIISAGSEERDYQEKRAEYLTIGVREYWIIDVGQQRVVQLRRWGRRWRETTVRHPGVCRTRLLPGFALATEVVFSAAE